MGVAFRSRDVLKGRKKIIEKGLKDINPNTKNAALEILKEWEGNTSTDRLVKLLGKEKTKKIMETLNNENQ